MKTLLVIFSLSLLFITFSNHSFAQSDELVVLQTELGNITIEFFPDDAPNHVSNFIELADSGFYDGTLFHRIIPGFMIQGGDPNTISGDESTWGTGGPETSVDAEFNSIKHNRGIVSMARAADPNSAGSQFFIVHKNSNFLDGQYSVFGRIVTQESFDTLDKIASVETKSRDIPVDIEQVRITKAEVVNRSEVSNLLELGNPERIESSGEMPTGNQMYQSEGLEVTFSAPPGWLLQEPEKVDENTPDVVAVGPKVGPINPVISLTITDTNGKSLDELILEKAEFLKGATESGNLEIISQEKFKINGKESYVTNAQGTFQSNGESFQVKFREIIISTPEKFYIFAYSNGIENFEDEISRFEESVNSFSILGEENNDQTNDVEMTNGDEGGGCLIATATYGSEMAPQVQLLREIRDSKVMSTESGASFMAGFNQFYYSFSPYVADYERENPVFKEMVRIGITPMLSTLSIMSMADSEQEILGYGIAVIMMNVGMYVAAPAMIVYGIKK
ncbi:peptidylprolyl isomerase [Nitrosopumilus sp. K4]|uniref:peptidylprolyl isomerase n=1 Tax=Nitrosopumilus sp. K4 TaxID=2795383 RepID=UPI001BA9DBFC|nr:peptidylprolyl isomerase [Nitrosopumilus sp. K4]QUC64593.1 peptidylprolyl isomerase [Nitrosopumilus sp. K4]